MGDQLGAVLAAVTAGSAALALHLLPAQHLHGLAERAWHKEPPLVAAQEGLLGLASYEDRRAALADLPVPVVISTVAAELNWVALVQLRVGIDLIEEHHLPALAPE